jgi:hypothetical protein
MKEILMSDSPEPAQKQPREITSEMIEKRAYELSQEDEARSPGENWQRAKRELLDEGAE